MRLRALLLATLVAACSSGGEDTPTDAGSTNTTTDAGKTEESKDAGTVLETTDAGTPVDAGTLPTDPQAEEKTSSTNAFVRVLNAGRLQASVGFNAAAATPEFSNLAPGAVSAGEWRGYAEVAAGSLAVKLIGQVAFYDPGKPPETGTFERTFPIVANKRYVLVAAVEELKPAFTNPQGLSFGPTNGWRMGLHEEPAATSDGSVPVTIVNASNLEAVEVKTEQSTLGTSFRVGSARAGDGEFPKASVPAAGGLLLVKLVGVDAPESRFTLPPLAANRPALLVVKGEPSLGVTNAGGTVKYATALKQLNVLNLLVNQAAPGGSLYLLPEGAAPLLVARDVPFLARSTAIWAPSGYLPYRWFSAATTTPATTTPDGEGTLMIGDEGTAILANLKVDANAARPTAFLTDGSTPPAEPSTLLAVSAVNATYDSATVALKDSNGATLGSAGLSGLGLAWIANVGATPAANQLLLSVTIAQVRTDFSLGTLSLGKGYRVYVSDAAPSGRGQPFVALLSSDGTMTRIDPLQP